MQQTATLPGQGSGALASFQEQVETRLRAWAADRPAMDETVGRAMAYSLLAPGKRVRARMVGAAAASWGGEPRRAVDAACAVELVHAASLILDDLPSMDDASLRRGQPCNHKVFGESGAILAAFGLLSEAFGLIARDDGLEPAQRTEAAEVLSAALGPAGLVTGQMRDLAQQRSAPPSLDEVEQTYLLKTAVLFAAAIEIGALLAGAGPSSRRAGYRCGVEAGIAFQIYDDLADHAATEASLGKDVGRDAGKPTVANILGPHAARMRADERLAAACAAVAGEVGEGAPLVADLQALGQVLQARLQPAQ